MEATRGEEKAEAEEAGGGRGRGSSGEGGAAAEPIGRGHITGEELEDSGVLGVNEPEGAEAAGHSLGENKMGQAGRETAAEVDEGRTVACCRLDSRMRGEKGITRGQAEGEDEDEALPAAELLCNSRD